VLPPNGLVCGDPETEAAPTGSAQVNDFVQPVPGAFTLLMCVQNTSKSTAQLNFNLLGGQ
jgi:hypothetical protein